jgi:hypothetical protein
MLGLGELKQRRGRWLRPGNVTIRVAEPITLEPGESPQDFTTRLELRMRELLAQSTRL